MITLSVYQQLDDAIAALYRVIGDDARVVYRGRAYIEPWAVDCLAGNGRSILGAGKNIAEAVTNAVAEFKRRHPSRETLCEEGASSPRPSR